MLITVGEIIKAQGIKGELKVRPLTDDVSRFRKLNRVYIKGSPFDIASLRISGEFVYLCLKSVSDRNAAESLVGLTVDIDRSDATKLPEDAYFISDLIGCKVFLSDGTEVGTVNYVYQHGAADVFEVKGKKNLMFPFIKRLNFVVDLQNKKIVLDKDEFDRVAVYED